MTHLNLSTIAIALGLLFALLNVFGVIKPAAFAAFARSFPRNIPIGWVLTLGATVWFLYYLSLETVSDFAAMKPFLFALFAGVGIGTCIFVPDFLAVRGLAVLLLLMAKLVTDSARLVESDWRLVLVTWAYVWVLAGMWLTISPWRLRDLINWGTASESRTRLFSGLRMAFGLFVMALGLTVLRTGS
jgi:hypothetical protein